LHFLSEAFGLKHSIHLALGQVKSKSIRSVNLVFLEALQSELSGWAPPLARKATLNFLLRCRSRLPHG
jgi:hypothetical protein